MQYQALMQQHEKLQNILEKYQQFIQQPANLQVEASFFVMFSRCYGGSRYLNIKFKSVLLPSDTNCLEFILVIWLTGQNKGDNKSD